MPAPRIRFNIPHVGSRERDYVGQVLAGRQLAGDGGFTARCNQWLEERTGVARALLTHSCTAALEMAALLLDIEPGDEVIMPSWTFVSTANAFVLRRAVPVFVDIREDTLNIDERLIEAAITPRTRAIVVVHYAGVASDMDAIMAIAERHGLPVVEDAAQGILASYKGRPLGGIGDFGALSFHESKNIVSGEGGALLVRDAKASVRAEIIREKGTDRSRFFRGEVDKYTWQEPGSSYLPSELVAACLLAQLEQAEEITAGRLSEWSRYHELLAPLEAKGLVRRPIVPDECHHNGHIYYILLNDGVARTTLTTELKHDGIQSLTHYVPLHSSPGGLRHGRTVGDMAVTDRTAGQLLRLPIWHGMAPGSVEELVGRIAAVLEA